MGTEHSDEGAPGPELLDELFPLERAANARRQAKSRFAAHRTPGPRSSGGTGPDRVSVPLGPGRAVESGRVAEVLRSHRAARRLGSIGDASSREGLSLESERSEWRRSAFIGAISALGGLAVRLVVVRVLTSRLRHLVPGRQRLGLATPVHLGTGELAVGALVIAVLVALCARRGVSIAVCAAVAIALSTIDLIAPVGVGLVGVVVLAERHRRSDL